MYIPPFVASILQIILHKYNLRNMYFIKKNIYISVKYTIWLGNRLIMTIFCYDLYGKKRHGFSSYIMAWGTMVGVILPGSLDIIHICCLASDNKNNIRKIVLSN